MGSLGNTALLEKVKAHELEGLGRRKALLSQLSTLGDLLEPAYDIRCPDQSDKESRRDLIRIFNEVSKELYGNLSPVVTEFGSFVMDMFSPDSDLDLSINFNNRDVPRNERIQTLRRFSKKFRKLQSKQMVKNVQLISSARVPVLKVTDCGTNIDCDFSVENRDGIAKSHIIFKISAIDERFRKLSFMLKAWAKTQGINSSKDGTLNSLSLILLAAFHLQCAEPPILPPFSALLKDGFDPSTVAKNVAPFVNYGQENKESLLQLFVTLLFRLKSVEKFWPEGLCVSAYEGSWLQKKFSKNIGISVEDFTDRSQNVARAVRPLQAVTIYESIEKSLSQINNFVEGKIDWQVLQMLLFGPSHPQLNKPMMRCGQSAILKRKIQPEADKEKTMAPSEGVLTRDKSAVLDPVLPNPTPKKKKKKAKKKAILAPSKGIKSETSVSPKGKKRLAEEKEGTSAPSKSVLADDQSAILVLCDPTPTKKKRLAAEKDSTVNQKPGKSVSSRTGGTSQGRVRTIQETEGFSRRGSYATQNPSRFMHGAVGMSVHGTSFPPLFAHELPASQPFFGIPPLAHELSSSRPFVGFPPVYPNDPYHQPSYLSAPPGFPGVLPNAPFHPPPQFVDRFPPLPDRSFDRPEVPPPYESGRLYRSYESARPHRSYEIDHLHRSYESARSDRPYESARSDRPYEPLRPHSPYEPLRPDRPYEPLRPDRPYEPLRSDRPYERLRSDRPYEPIRSDRPYEPIRSDRPYEPIHSDRPYEPIRSDRPYEPIRSDRSYESAHPRRAHERDRRYEAPRGADRPHHY